MQNHWFIRYKLYHLFFWAGYHFIWWTLWAESPVTAFDKIFSTDYFSKYIFYVVCQACGVYFTLYYLFPRYLQRGRYWAFLGWLTLTIFVTATLTLGGYYLSAFLSDKTFAELFDNPPERFLFLFKANSFPSTISAMTLAMSIKLAKNWLEANRRQSLLEREKMATELKLLKSQFNPHFLFNTINSIFVLIHKNPDLASEALAKFSHLLRHQLYECNEPQIPLEQELSYLDSFIELAKLRQDHHLTTTTHINPLGSHNYTIAPFLLISFIENAFKHVSQCADRQNWIDIQMEIQNGSLSFTVENSISPVEGDGGQHDSLLPGGIGLQNVGRRLALQYPDRHQLFVRESEEIFRVQLQLDLMPVAAPKAVLSPS